MFSGSRRIRQKVCYRIERMKSLSVHGDYGDSDIVLFKRSRLQICHKLFSVPGEYKRIRKIRQEYFAVFREYA